MAKRTKKQTFDGHPIVGAPKGKITHTMLVGGVVYSGRTARRTPALGFIVCDPHQSAATIVMAECACKVFVLCPLAKLLEIAGDAFDATTVERRVAVKPAKKVKPK